MKTESHVGTSLESVELAGSSSSRAGLVKSTIAGAVMGFRRALTADTHPSGSIAGTDLPVCEFNERQEKVRQIYLALLEQLGSIDQSELQPGQRREAMHFLGKVSADSADFFFDAFERIFYTSSKKISDRTKSSALRFYPDFITRADKSKSIAFLLSQLGSLSPAQASAAAVGLSEIADRFSVPALMSARKHVRWPSVQDDIDQTIAEISSQ